jgi:AraC-like DNA-binding protein
MGRRATADGFGLGELAGGERARFFAAGRDRALACLSATFTSHAYAPHTHDSYVLGTVTSGFEAFNVAGRPHVIGPGEVCFLEPGVVHDGRPAGDGFTYRITYPDASVLADIAADASERTAEAPYFGRPVVADADLAVRLAAAHMAAERDGPTLASDVALHAAYALAIARYAEAGGAVAAALERRMASERAAVGRALAYLDAHFAENVDLERLAAAADVPRTRLIRAMRRQTGMTPHAWLTDRRVREAVRQLAAGAAPVDVAVACGFCDQSHLNRAFRARVGVAPGAFRAARASLSSKTGRVPAG